MTYFTWNNTWTLESCGQIFEKIFGKGGKFEDEWSRGQYEKPHQPQGTDSQPFLDKILVDGTFVDDDKTQEVNVTRYFVHSNQEINFKGQVRNWCKKEDDDDEKEDNDEIYNNDYKKEL